MEAEQARNVLRAVKTYAKECERLDDLLSDHPDVDGLSDELVVRVTESFIAARDAYDQAITSQGIVA